MAVTLKQWKEMIEITADFLLEKADELSKIDAAIGDGDHGVTIGKIAALMKEKAAADADSKQAFFDDLGWDVINVQGGSAGPLYGTFLSGMQNSAEDASVYETMKAGLAELQTISKAMVGEKTMMDALIPGVEAMENAASEAEALEKGAAAAAAGAQATENFVAHYGRAKNYGEKSLGFKDAGACSMAYIFEGLKMGYKE